MICVRPQSHDSPDSPSGVPRFRQRIVAERLRVSVRRGARPDGNDSCEARAALARPRKALDVRTEGIVRKASYGRGRHEALRRTNAFQRGAREGAARRRLIALGRREAATLLSNHADRDHRLPTHLATRSVPLFFVLVATSRDWAAPPAFGSTPAKERAGPSSRGSMHTHLAALAAWQLHPARDGCSYVSAVPRVEACGAPGTPGGPVAEGAPALGVGARRILWQHLASQGLRWLCRPAA